MGEIRIIKAKREAGHLVVRTKAGLVAKIADSDDGIRITLTNPHDTMVIKPVCANVAIISSDNRKEARMG